MPTNAPVKFGWPGAVASSERMLASNYCGSHCHSRTLDLVAKAQALVIHFDLEMHAPARRDRDWRCEDIGLDLVGHTGHHAKVLADALVVRDVEIVELRAVVVADETRHLLKMSRLDLDHRAGAETVRLLAPRDERLAKLAADRLSTVEAQVTRAGATG